MPKLHRLSGRQVIYSLEKLGFTQVRQRGSHVVLRKAVPGGSIGCVVPLHPELAVGTLRGILKQAGITAEDLLKAVEGS
jgi:predicted RNA binding protein YcfA (HicA-like mRNA interferase family)